MIFFPKPGRHRIQNHLHRYLDLCVLVQHHYEQWCTDHRAPLYGIDIIVPIVRNKSYISLDCGNAPCGSMAGICDAIQKPSFKNLSEEVMLYLRACIWEQKEENTVNAWMEKLLRHFEVIFPSLKQRALKKWNTAHVAKMNLLHLSVLFLDYFTQTHDLRFFNFSLKLSDLDWIIDPKKMENNISSGESDLIGALFQFRILLTQEYTIQQLYNGVQACERV